MTARMYAAATSPGAVSDPADPAGGVTGGPEVVPTEPAVSVEQAAMLARNRSATSEVTPPATTRLRLGVPSAGNAGPGSEPFPSPEIDPEG